MMRRLFCLAVIASLAIAAGMRGQSSAESDKPVWTMEFLKVKPGKFEMTLGSLDDGRISEQGTRESERNIVLLTEYKNQVAYEGRDSLFAKIRKELPSTPAIMRNAQPEELYVVGTTRVFEDHSDSGDPRMKLLAEK
jgi:hypothetical protein